MDVLESIVLNLSADEARYYKILAGRITSPEERKDILLFNHIRKSGDVKITRGHSTKHSYDGKANAFYRLRNRLTEDIHKSLLHQHFGRNDTIRLMNLITLARIYSFQNKLELAFRVLSKAKSIAHRHDEFLLLDMIYNDMIALSIQISSLDGEGIISERKENFLKLQCECEINHMIAVINSKLRKSNFSGREKDVLPKLNRIQKDLEVSKDLYMSPNVRLRISQCVSSILLEKKEFIALEKYLLKTYRSFIDDNIFDKNNHGRKLLMITWISNALFKNLKFEEALKYTELLHGEMLAYNRLHYDMYAIFYRNRLAECYSFLHRNPEAIRQLEELKKSEELKQNNFYRVFIFFNLALLYFSEKDFKNASMNLSKIWISDGYENLDAIIKIYMNIADVIFHFEMRDTEHAEYRLKRIKKEFYTLLEEKIYKREKLFLEILAEMSRDRMFFRNKNILKKINTFLLLKIFLEPGENEGINYNIWLQSKLKNVSYYSLLLDKIAREKQKNLI